MSATSSYPTPPCPAGSIHARVLLYRWSTNLRGSSAGRPLPSLARPLFFSFPHLDFHRKKASSSPRVLVANDPLIYSAFGLSQALETLPLVVDYVTDIRAAAGDISRAKYDVVVFPKIVGLADFSDLYGILVTFLYDGGAVILGPTTYDVKITAVFTQSMASEVSFYGDVGTAVTIDCGYAAVPVYNSSNRSAQWNASSAANTTTTTTASSSAAILPSSSWPSLLSAGLASDNPTSYSANCGPLGGSLGGGVMYSDSSPMKATTVFSLPRGSGRFYYVGLDFDNDPRDGSWGQLLSAIAVQAASNPLSGNGSPPSPSPPPPPPVTAPEEPGLYDINVNTSSSTTQWPLGRGRLSYTAAGLTATSALTAPPSPAASRTLYLCHDLPVVNGTGAAANGSSNSSGGGGAWLVIDLGTRRRVASVRIQALEAGYDNRSTIRGVPVRVGAVPPNDVTDPAAVNDPLCPALAHTIWVGAAVASGSAAVQVSCGANNSLVGRYVSLQLQDDIPGASWARMCGVDVMGVLPAKYIT
ncbi:hypothetical protein VOLCADRAFT_92005 [Volvox carteri f. nagariensis]|uniref:Uncharacterized protein n=1 Tax=Volvox carteri f. nagariensis TaxID=3068 RepID=D8TYI4_VOLCA|nr:uncharacterized protein VOLCADRAFT_92005 [Volvox carteri f. nagariensis]EFJ47646.1 hypothetical protein VOLCADRAFT_92005 [Volvox carteri f. nagariensis]|eukprot:XP_002951470.1 hypothetical protein VOLCADRAFT_92005 [Volvox carteri f. nagariensis]